ncbi:Mitogen-activated protein kinase kinase kinase 12, partial [Operophtera brumata]
MEQHAIMWGVGTDSVSLPIPAGLPNSIHVLLVQCWNRRYQNRYAPCGWRWRHASASWPSECPFDPYPPSHLHYTRGAEQPPRPEGQETRSGAAHGCHQRPVLRDMLRAAGAGDTRACRCGVRRTLRIHRQISSSSDGVALNRGYRAHLKKPESKLSVNIINDRPITTAVDKPCQCEDKINHNIRLDNVECRKDTTVEVNGNIDVKRCVKPLFGHKKAAKGLCAAVAEKGDGRESSSAHAEARAARAHWSPMEPPALTAGPAAPVRAAPGASADLVLPLPKGTQPFTYH